MKNLLNKLFFKKNNLNNISQDFKDLSLKNQISKIFEAINSFSHLSEIRYVGGCVRKIINGEKVDDIDLATNLEPAEICEVLKKNKIDYHETGIEHGTITAIIDDCKFEITSLREDITTDGRHAKVKFSKDWKKDASRRDFTINAIYSDREGNLFDPFNGVEDLKKGEINFIGDSEKRIQEDYLRILRYLRFFLTYSKQKHNPEIIKNLKKNLIGISNLSKERLLDELKKIFSTEILLNLSRDKSSLEIFNSIFPELKYFNLFSKLNSEAKKLIKEVDFILLISLLIIDDTDNSDYFLYKFNISKKEKRRIINIDNFFKENKSLKEFDENNLNKIFYYQGKESVIDILKFKIFKLKKIDNKLMELLNLYKDKQIPIMPVKAKDLMKKFNISEGKFLGEKLKIIEKEWVKNNFKISDQVVKNIIIN